MALCTHKPSLLSVTTRSDSEQVRPYPNLPCSATHADVPFPFRLAYISLIHELLSWSIPIWRLLQKHQQLPPTSDNDVLRGLDIGTGASAIYPILGVACFPQWNFIGTEIDADSLVHAKQHIVERPDNDTRLSDRVKLLHVDADAPFIPEQEDAELAFTMCNPPFYTSFEEMDRSAQLKRLPANAVSCSPSRHVLSSTGFPLTVSSLLLFFLMVV